MRHAFLLAALSFVAAAPALSASRRPAAPVAVEAASGSLATAPALTGNWTWSFASGAHSGSLVDLGPVVVGRFANCSGFVAVDTGSSLIGVAIGCPSAVTSLFPLVALVVARHDGSQAMNGFMVGFTNPAGWFLGSKQS